MSRRSKPPAAPDRTTASKAAASPRPWLWPAALLVWCGILYIRSLGFPLHWSDDVIYLDDPRLTSLSLANLAAIFSKSYLANYHPVTTLTYVVDRALYGAWLPGYHATQLGFYLGGVYLVYRLFLRLLGTPTAALAAAALFATHAVHVEVVAFLAQRKDLVCLVFFAGATLTYARFVDGERRNRGTYGIVLLLSALAMLAKGYGVILPAVFLAYDLCFTERRDWRLLLDKLPVAALSLLVTIVTLLAQGRDDALESAAVFEISVAERLNVLGGVFAAYVGRTLWPVHLSFDYAVGPQVGAESLSWPWALFGIGLAVALVVVAVRSYRRQPLVTFGIALYLLPLATVMNVFWTLSTWMNDRYLFLPTIGSSLAVVALARQLPAATRRRRELAVVAAVVVLGYSALTYARLDVWESEVALRSATLRYQLGLTGDGPVTPAELRRSGIKKLPNLNSFLSLVAAYERAGKTELATELRHGLFTNLEEGGDPESKLAMAERDLTAGNPDAAIARLRPLADSGRWRAGDAWMLIGRAEEKAKRPDRAAEAYRAAVERFAGKGMSAASAMLRLGSLAMETGDRAAANDWFRRAAEASDPNDPRPTFRLAQSLESGNALDEAAATYARAISVEGRVPPTLTFDFTDVYASAGMLAERRGRKPEALELFAEALRRSKDPVQRAQIELKRAMLFESLGNDDEAMTRIEVALRENPSHPERDTYRIRAAEIAERKKAPARAVGYLEEVLRLSPQHAERGPIMLKIGLLLEQAGDGPKALGYYERGLAAAPEFPDRAKVVARIELLKARTRAP